MAMRLRTLALLAATGLWLASGGASVAQSSGVTNPCGAIGVTPVQLKTVMPTFFSTASKNQTAADCFAWQEFIYLNWKADPNNPGTPDPKALPTSFGTPNDTSATVWESFLTATQVFTQPIARAKTAWQAKRPAMMSLFKLSKLGDAVLDLASIGQAGDGKWITDQRGVPAFYEIHLNQDEYAYITTNVFNKADLTTFAGQLACASQPGQNGRGGFNLPSGNAQGNTDVDCKGNVVTYGQGYGAIEIKAAWVALPANGSLNYRYKTALAQYTLPGGKPVTATMGLVGLHIIHKVPGANQFIWATFEHIDNDPDDNNGNPTAPTLPPNPNQKPSPGYTFFNPKCNPQTDTYYQCKPNTLPGNACPIGKPPTPGCFPYAAPMQITRIVTVDQQANSVTGYAWSILPAASVFNYYRLIDVQWPNAASPVPPQATVPLSTGDITPASASHIVANTTLETYMQTKNSCMDCHQYAAIAQRSQQKTAQVAGRNVRRVLLQSGPRAANGTPQYASDYSFVFSAETRH
jgi:hypothetical protein